jgi:hypothetical protein
VAAVTDCPRPDKTGYATEAAARGWHADDLARLPDEFTVYLCRCGAWHGGRAAKVTPLLGVVRSFGPPLDTTVAAVARIVDA